MVESPTNIWPGTRRAKPKKSDPLLEGLKGLRDFLVNPTGRKTKGSPLRGPLSYEKKKAVEGPSTTKVA